VLASALKRIFRADNSVRIIGTRHGEKAYETLLTCEEMLRAVDLGAYYRIPADNRDLNYDAYFVEGHGQVSALSDYNSNNTCRLSEDEVVEMLLKLDFIRQELNGWHQN
jgi:UDP-glucose 4-epimerase